MELSSSALQWSGSLHPRSSRRKSYRFSRSRREMRVVVSVVIAGIVLLSSLSMILPTVSAGEDYYSILGLQRDASDFAIKKSYRALVKRYHPDKHSDPKEKERAQQHFLRITKAYEVLSDPEKRGIYDQYGEQGLEQHTQGGGGGGQAAQEFFFGSGGGGANFFEDLFSGFGDFFGGGGQQQQARGHQQFFFQTGGQQQGQRFHFGQGGQQHHRQQQQHQQQQRQRQQQQQQQQKFSFPWDNDGGDDEAVFFQFNL